jgi:hypothetical protein
MMLKPYVMNNKKIKTPTAPQSTQTETERKTGEFVALLVEAAIDSIVNQKKNDIKIPRMQ